MYLSNSVLDRIKNRETVDSTHLVADYDTFLKWIAWLICDEGNEEANVELLCRRLVNAGYLRIEDDVYKTLEE